MVFPHGYGCWLKVPRSEMWGMLDGTDADYLDAKDRVTKNTEDPLSWNGCNHDQMFVVRISSCQTTEQRLVL